MVTADIINLDNTVFTYSAAVVFSNESSSNSCAVLFTTNYGYLLATTTFIMRYVCNVYCFYLILSFCRSNEIQYLELFQASTSLNQDTGISVILSTNSELMLEEPLPVSSVITFGIEGDCILDELTVNASIDDIYGNDGY